jgi:transposase
MSRERPSKLTPERHARIVELLKQGNFFDAAVRAAGVHPSTAYRWIQQGELTPEPGSEEFRALDLDGQILAAANSYRQFAEDVRNAVAEAEVTDVALIGAAAQTDWRAAAWRRERMNPVHWGADRFRKAAEQEALAVIDEKVQEVLAAIEAVLAATIPDHSLRDRVHYAVLERLSALYDEPGDQLAGAPAPSAPRAFPAAEPQQR